MRLFPLIAAGATLVSAAPISVVVSTAEVAAFRHGHPVAVADAQASQMLPPGRMRHLCKSMQSGVSRIFAFAGLGPAIPDAATFVRHPPHAPAHRPAHAEGELPKPFWLKPGSHIQNHEDEPGKDTVATADDNQTMDRPHRHPHHYPHFRPHMIHRHRGSFLRRIHRALMSLGPWEGRAVAFVLGCGIGVLLRTVWVIVVLSYRAIRGVRSENDEPEYVEGAVLLPIDAEEIFVAPPEYTDEKVERAGDIKA